MRRVAAKIARLCDAQMALAVSWASHGPVVFVVPTEALAEAVRKADRRFRAIVFTGDFAPVRESVGSVFLHPSLAGHADFDMLDCLATIRNAPVEAARRRLFTPQRKRAMT